jgi:fibronectin-binding autotransporter adhesin
MSSLRIVRPSAFRLSALALASLGIGLLSGSPAHAATETWVGSATAWATGGNWTGPNLPPVSGDSLVFATSGAGGPDLNNNLTTSSFNLAGITFNSGASAFVIGNGSTTANAGNAFALTGSITNNGTKLETINDPFALSTTQTFSTNSGGGNLTLSGSISGGGGINIAGGGVVTLSSSANSYTGAVTVAGGTLSVSGGTNGIVVSAGGASSLGNAASPVTLSGGGDLGYAGNTVTYTRGFTIGAGGGEFDVATSGQTVTSGSVLSLASGGMTFGGAGSTTLNTGAAIPFTGSGTLTKNGAGTLTIQTTGVVVTAAAMPIVINAGKLQQNTSGTSLANPLGTGQITIAPGGELQLGSGSSPTDTYTNAISINNSAGTAQLDSNAGIFTMSGPVAFAAGASGPTLQLFNGNGNANSSFTLSGSISGPGNIVASGNSGGGEIVLSGTVNNSGTFTNLGTNAAASLTVSGPIGSNVTTVTQNGNAPLILSGSNSYTGGTTVTTGLLEFSITAAQPSSGTTSVSNPGTLALGVGAAGGYTAANIDSLFEGTMLNVTGGTIVGVDTTAGNFTYASSGNGGAKALNKLGANTLIMTGNDTYTGGSTVTAGVLDYQVTAAQPSSGTTSVLAAGTLALGVGTAAGYFTAANVDSLFENTLANVVSASNAGVGIDTTAGNFTYLTLGNSSAMSLTKLGPNTLILTGSNLYTGSTTISGGTLQLSGSATLGSGATYVPAIVNNGALVLSSSIDQKFNGVISGSGNLYQLGTNEVTIEGGSTPNTFTGTVFVNAGQLNLSKNANVIAVPGNIIMTGGLLSMANANQTATTTSITLTGNAQISSAMTDTVTNLSDTGSSSGKLNFGTGSSITVLDQMTLVNTPLTYTGNYSMASNGSNSTLTVGSLGSGVLSMSNAGYSLGQTGNTHTCTLFLSGSFVGNATNVLFNADSLAVLNLGGGTQTFNIQTGTTTISPSLQNGGISVPGPGTLILNGTSTYASGTSVAAGILDYQIAAAQPSSGTTTVAAAATLALGVGTTTAYFSAANVDSLFENTLANVVSASNAGVGIDTTAGNFTYTTSGNSSAMSLNVMGPNTLTLGGSDAYTGTTYINGGVLSLANSAALAGGGNITFGGGTLQFSASNTQDYSASIVNSPAAISIDPNGQSVTFNSPLNSSNSGGLTLAGSNGGTLTLAATNAYGGTTTLVGGTLALAVSNALPVNTTVSFNGNATLDLGATSSQTIAALTTNTVANTSMIQNIGAGQTMSIVSGGTGAIVNLGYSGAFTGTNTFTVSGPGALAVSATNGTFQVAAADVTGAPTTSLAVVNMYGLGTFTANVNEFDAGVNQGANSSGDVLLVLAGTNTITAPTMYVGKGELDAGGMSAVVILGTSNTLDVGNLIVAAGKGTSVGQASEISWTGVTPGTFTLAGITGGTSRAEVTLGVYDYPNGTSSSPMGTIDLTGGTASVFIDVLTLGEGNRGTINAGTTTEGNFIFTAGSVNVNTINVGETTALNNVSTSAQVIGNFTIGGGTLAVNTTLTLGVKDGTAVTPVGTFNLNGGLFQSFGTIASGGGTSYFNFNGGTLQAESSSTTFMQGLTGANVGNGGAFVDTNGNNITIGQALLASGSGGLTKLGSGMLTLTGVNTYTGATTVSAGTLELQNSGDVFSSSFSIAAGATMVAYASGANFIEFDTVPLTGPGMLTIDGDNSGSLYQNRVLVRSANNNLTGTVNITPTGRLWIDNSGGQAGATIGTATVNDNGLLTLFSAGATFSAAIGGLNGNGNIVNEDGDGNINTFTIGAGGGSGSFSGVISEVSAGVVSGLPSPLAIVKTGSGIQVFSGPNSYSGGTQIQSGVLQLGNSAALGTGALAADGGTLDMEGYSVIVPSFSGASGVVTDFGTGGGTGTALIVSQSTATTFGGTIIDGPTNKLVLALIGSGTLYLAGTNSYSGGTIVADGALIATNNEAIEDGTNVYVGSDLLAFGTVISAQASSATSPPAVAPVPEPGTLALLATGVVFAIGLRCQKGRKAKSHKLRGMCQAMRTKD